MIAAVRAALLALAVMTGTAVIPESPSFHHVTIAEAQPGQPGSRPAAPARRKRAPAPEEPQPRSAATEPAAVPEAPELGDDRELDRRARPPGAVDVPRTAPGATVKVPLADGLPGGRSARGDLPPAWEAKRFAGRIQFELGRDDGRPVFRLASRASSFALHRDVAVDLEQFPILTWSWKVTRLPPRGDVRDQHTNDQAAQVYLIFPRSPSPRTRSDVLGYVWDSQAPVGLTAVNHQWGNVRVFVLQSGERRAGTWIREERNVRQDYIALFGTAPPLAGKLALMTDSDQTRSQSEAFFGELTFQRAAAPPTSQPRSPN
jgi:hypothetical protein